MKQILVSFLVILILSGCQAKMYGTAADLNNISVGMSKKEVLKILGEPMTSGANADKMKNI